jgi:hypothetical protein
MRKGNFSYFDKKMGVGFDLHVESVKEGSLSNGTRQAVVVLSCDYPVGGTAAAYLYDEHRTGASLLGEIATANWGGDWGRGPDSIRVRFANHRLFVEQCKDPECAAMSATAYALRAGKLRKVSPHSRGG